MADFSKQGWGDPLVVMPRLRRDKYHAGPTVGLGILSLYKDNIDKIEKNRYDSLRRIRYV